MAYMVTEGYTRYRDWRFLGLRYRSDLIAGDYMRRWTLSTPWGMIRLHHILRSDQDRHHHDHPFDFVSLILVGGYVEYRPDWPSRICPPGTIVTHRAEDLHTLKLLGRSAWTLVLASPIRRSWGFMTEDGWIPANRYDEWKAAQRRAS